MTIQQAKMELKEIKVLQADIDVVNEEIEMLYGTITRMTSSLDKLGVQSSSQNRLEETLIKIDKYRTRLQKLVGEMISHKEKCLAIVEKIEPKTLRTILMYYYFQNHTLEQTAEYLNHSYQWTYDLFTSALEKYCELHDTF